MPKKNDTQKLQFDGIATPNTTQCPDVYFDQVFPQLKETELKALLYIVRRTFGFKKNCDPISFNQFLRGITTRDGRVLDLGCGVRDRTTLSRALKSLEAIGVIVSDKGVDERGENVTTMYSLRFKEATEGVVGNSYHPGRNRPLPVVGISYPQDTVEQKTVIQETDLSSNGFDGDANLQHSRKRSRFSKSRDKIANEHANRQVGEGMPVHKGEVTAVGHLLSQRLTDRLRDAVVTPKTGRETASSPRNDSEYLPEPSIPAERPRRGRPPKLPPYLEDLVDRYSGELHDDDHVAQNRGQAARLWKASGWSEAAFSRALIEAKAITTKRDIRKRAVAGGEFGWRNKMPYFFVVLKDLLAVQDADTGAGEA